MSSTDVWDAYLYSQQIYIKQEIKKWEKELLLSTANSTGDDYIRTRDILLKKYCKLIANIKALKALKEMKGIQL